jgi:hypothetical protein
MSSNAQDGQGAYKPFPYWKIVALVVVVPFVAFLMRDRFRISDQLLSSWGANVAVGIPLCCGAEAILRRRAGRTLPYWVVVALALALSFPFSFAWFKGVNEDMIASWLATSVGMSLGFCISESRRRRRA